jgi:uncharacterized protein YyaL (SSP411 family)
MTNHLVRTDSLYLRKHIENPIDWWPWCEEALETARRENKPIFLSIGYSSCHWCTVMEGEAFSDPTIAEYMNANFLPIKVDREERPDIDSILYAGPANYDGSRGLAVKYFLNTG